MSARFHELPFVDSTNSWLARHLGELPSGSVAYTLNQTVGRGRQGRRWLSPEGDGLAFSVLIDDLPTGFCATWVPLLAGVSLLECVRKLGVAGAGLKWPNDVLVGQRKLAGILVEVLADSRMGVGIGLNLRPIADSTSEICATSLLCQGVSVSDVLADIVTPVSQRLIQLIDEGIGFGASLAHDHWKSKTSGYLTTLGSRVQWARGTDVIEMGTAMGLTDTGALVVKRDGRGDDVILHSGDVFEIERS